MRCSTIPHQLFTLLSLLHGCAGAEVATTAGTDSADVLTQIQQTRGFGRCDETARVADVSVMVARSRVRACMAENSATADQLARCVYSSLAPTSWGDGHEYSTNVGTGYIWKLCEPNDTWATMLVLQFDENFAYSNPQPCTNTPNEGQTIHQVDTIVMYSPNTSAAASPRYEIVANLHAADWRQTRPSTTCSNWWEGDTCLESRCDPNLYVQSPLSQIVGVSANRFELSPGSVAQALRVYPGSTPTHLAGFMAFSSRRLVTGPPGQE